MSASSSAPDRAAERRARELLGGLEMFGQKLGLERVRSLLEALGSPQHELRCVLVGGTNGKGSTACALAAIGHAAGYRTGLYTSPHLESVRERVRIDGRALPWRQLLPLLEEVVAVAEDEQGAPATYFETLTAAALLGFARAGVELAVLEVGLGGRLDATNVTEPVLSIVTSIAHDHTEQLGGTVASIAREKAGIFRGGRPALTFLPRQHRVRGVLAAAAARRGAELRELAREIEMEPVAGAAGAQLLRLRTGRGEHLLETPLAGRHQRGNLALAVVAAETLAAAGFERLDAEAIRDGVRRARWPGRLEAVDLPAESRREIPCGHVLLDGAHNEAGMRSLGDELARSGRAYDAIYGTVRRRGVGRILRALAPRVRSLTLTRPDSPRAMDPTALARRLPEALADAAVEPDLGAALDAVGTRAAEGILVCGSLYLVGEARTLLRARYGVPPPAAEIPSS